MKEAVVCVIVERVCIRIQTAQPDWLCPISSREAQDSMETAESRSRRLTGCSVGPRETKYGVENQGLNPQITGCRMCS